MSGVWSNPLAYHTSRLLAIVAKLPEDEYRSIVKSVLEGGDAELVAFHWGAFNTILYNWAMFEEECRGKRRCSHREYLPEGVEPGRASSFFSEELRRLIVNACVDLAPDWVLPSWVKWVAARFGVDLSVLKKLEWSELLGRLVDYSVYVWGVRGISQSHLEYYQIEGMEYASVVASHVHWELVEATAEPLEAAIEPLRREFSVVLESVRKAAFEAAIRFIESGGKARLGLLDQASEAIRKLRLALIRVLEDTREMM